MCHCVVGLLRYLAVLVVPQYYAIMGVTAYQLVLAGTTLGQATSRIGQGRFQCIRMIGMNVDHDQILEGVKRDKPRSVRLYACISGKIREMAPLPKHFPSEVFQIDEAPFRSINCPSKPRIL